MRLGKSVIYHDLMWVADRLPTVNPFCSPCKKLYVVV